MADAEFWRQKPENDVDASACEEDASGWPAEHAVECRLVLSEIETELANVIGRASMRDLLGEVTGALQWSCGNYDPAKGSFLAFARATARVAWRRAQERITWPALGREKADEDRRRSAVGNERAMAAYLTHVRDETIAWIAHVRRRPRCWVAEDARYQDEVFAVTLRILELLRDDDPIASFGPYERVGIPAFYQVRDM